MNRNTCLLNFHLSAERTLETAWSKIHLACQVNIEETGKQVVFHVLNTEKTKPLEKKKTVWFCWPESEEVQVLMADGLYDLGTTLL